MPRDTGLYRALQRRGLKVEYVPGWTTRGSSNFAPFGALAHWTAGPATGNRPSLNICVNGRAGLPGPLCQVFLDRNGVAIVVAAGRANHAGRGSWKGATGNTHLYGVEVEWNGKMSNLTAAQREAYPKVMATFMDRGAKWIAGHDEYALPRGRKVDVGNYINTLRPQTYALANKSPEGELSVSDINRILSRLDDLETHIRSRPISPWQQSIDLSDSAMEALSTGRRTWIVEDLFSTLAHRIGLTNMRTYTAAREPIEPTVNAIGKLHGVTQETIITAIAEAKEEAATEDPQ